jgi:hypothetical protein
MDAFVTAQAIILDFENRVRLATATANEPFLFYTGVGESCYTGMTAWSLKGLSKAFQKVSAESLEFHNKRGDFEKWATNSLHDKTLAEKLKEIRLSKVRGETLRKSLVKATKERFNEVSEQVQATTRYF